MIEIIENKVTKLSLFDTPIYFKGYLKDYGEVYCYNYETTMLLIIDGIGGVFYRNFQKEDIQFEYIEEIKSEIFLSRYNHSLKKLKSKVNG